MKIMNNDVINRQTIVCQLITSRLTLMSAKYFTLKFGS